MMTHFWSWFAVSMAVLALCMFLPIRIRDERRRRLIYWLVLIPASLILIGYIYPKGIELMNLFAVSGK